MLDNTRLAPIKKGAPLEWKHLVYLLETKLIQMYNILDKKNPPTKIISFQEYKKEQNGKRKEYILKLLEHYTDGLSCREISEITGIWVQSLTNPLLELQRQGSIQVKNIKRSNVSNRLVQVYTLNS